MPLDPQSRAADVPGEDLGSVPVAAESQSGAATAAGSAPGARGWRWVVLSLIAIVVVFALGIYFGFENFLRAPEKAAARVAAKLPPEPSDQTIGERTSDSDRQDRLPLDPLVPESGAGLIAEAKRVASDLAERFPQNPDSHEMLARFHLEFADQGAAVKAWQRCLALDANYAYAHVGLAKVATERGELAEAVAHWRRAVLADPATLAHQIELGKALLAAGEVDEAIAALAVVVKADPTNPQGHAELGSAHLQKRDEAAAKAAFETALALDPRYATAHFGLATACVRLGLVEQAREHEAKYTEFRSDRTRAARGARRDYDDDRALGEDIAGLYTDIGSVFLATGRAAPAEQLWRRAARLHAENRASRQALAWLMLQQNKPLESILMLRELARLEPENVAYPAEMARLYGELDRVDDAQRTLEEFAESAPANAAAPRVLAEFFLSAKNEPVLAVKYAQKAAELSGAASDWVLLSAAHERAGDLPAAVAALERASGLAPDNLQYRQLLALLKQRAAAQNAKEAAPPRKPDPPRSDLGASPAANAPDSR